MTRFTPNDDRVLIEPVPVDEKLGSIFIPDRAKDKPSKGTVIEIGDDPAIKYKSGDRVIYGKYAGSVITIDNKDFLIMRNADIFGSFT